LPFVSPPFLPILCIGINKGGSPFPGAKLRCTIRRSNILANPNLAVPQTSGPLCDSIFLNATAKSGRNKQARDAPNPKRTVRERAVAGARATLRRALHDVWAIDLPRARSGITLDEFLKATSRSLSKSGPSKPAPAVRILFGLRLFLGRLLGWDREPPATAWESFAARMTNVDRAKSLLPEDAREGPFRVVYRFENEQLLELINRTVHAAALSALVEIEAENIYRYYLAIYVQPIGRFMPIYMALIDPFRKVFVYPALLQSLRTKWSATFVPNEMKRVP